MEIGSTDNEGNKINSGKDALAKAVKILHGINPNKKIAYIFDCDVKKLDKKEGYLYEHVMKCFSNSKKINIGIENALILDSLDINGFYETIEKQDDYGGSFIIKKLNKMKLCEYIYSLPDEQLQIVFSRLKSVIDQVITFLNE